MSPNKPLVDAITDLLLQTEQAHLAYQQLNGPTEWPQWYAIHMADTLGEEYTQQEILAALLSAAEAHGEHEKETGEPDADWAHWYAEHMAKQLKRPWYQRAAKSLGESDWEE